MLLFAIFCFGILTLWVPSRWALTAFQLAIFLFTAIRIPVWSGLISPRRSTNPDPSIVSPFRRNWLLPALLGAAVLWIVAQLTFGWTVDAQRTQSELLNWITNLCAVLLAMDLAASGAVSGDSIGQRSIPLPTNFLELVLYFSVALAILGMLTLASSPPGVIAWLVDVGTAQPTLGPFVYRNQYAAFTEISLAIAISRALKNPRHYRYLLFASVLFASVVASGSRGGTILCLAEIVVIPALALWQGVVSRSIWIRVVLGTVVSILAATSIAGWDLILSRFSAADPYALRADLLTSSLAMLADRPWTGFGLGTWPEVYPGYALYDAGLYVNQAHNDWAQWLSEGGIPFFIIVVTVFSNVLLKSVKSLWGVGILALAVHCFFDYPMQQRPALTAFFFALIGFLAADSSRLSGSASAPRETSL